MDNCYICNKHNGLIDTCGKNINVQAYLDMVNAPWGKLFYKLVWHKIDCKGKRILDFGKIAFFHHVILKHIMSNSN